MCSATTGFCSPHCAGWVPSRYRRRGGASPWSSTSATPKGRVADDRYVCVRAAPATSRELPRTRRRSSREPGITSRVTMDDPFDWERFVVAQDAGGTYDRAVEELRRGEKASHWMWFVFPQLAGLGRSPNALKFALS